ncbi:hypothetical protein C0995_016467, partial [Termitomyces sp. Mi166
MLSIYQGKYQKWVQENKLGSKLPGDVKKCKADAERVMRTLDRDLKEKKLKERVAKYTHKEFCRATIEWLVATDQHWPKDLHVKVLKCVKEVFQERFLRFNDSEDPKKTEVPKSSAKGLKVLLHELSDDENEDDMSNMVSSMKNHGFHHTEDPNRPWSRYFDEYLETQENVLE